MSTHNIEMLEYYFLPGLNLKCGWLGLQDGVTEVQLNNLGAFIPPTLRR